MTKTINKLGVEFYGPIRASSGKIGKKYGNFDKYIKYCKF